MEKQYNLYLGDSLEVLKTFKDNSIDSIVTDPPYGLSFMNKKWDTQVPGVEIWEECLRVLKPGGHLLAFAGTRTQHRMAVNIEDAGFEIRDMLAWAYGSGFPKSLNISKSIDKQNDRPATHEAIKYEGWGTALKPALEPITLARKPLDEKTIAANVLKHGTGGINIDGCRIETDDNLGRECYQTQSWKNTSKKGVGSVNSNWEKGRFPANFIHDGGEENLDILQDKARYFYCPKTSKIDRNEGLDESFEDIKYSSDGRMKENETAHQRNKSTAKNNHPTVKPTELMQYLCRLITPRGGTVLDPFSGSGSTGKAAVREDFKYIGIDLDQNYIEIAKARIDFELKKKNIME